MANTIGFERVTRVSLSYRILSEVHARGWDYCATLDQLTKKEYFWSEKATKAFKALKKAMTTLVVLAIPNFTKEFVVEIDVSRSGLEVVLMQGGKHIVFISKALQFGTKVNYSHEGYSLCNGSLLYKV